MKKAGLAATGLVILGTFGAAAQDTGAGVQQDTSCAPYIEGENLFIDDCRGNEPLSNWSYAEQKFDVGAGRVEFKLSDGTQTSRDIIWQDMAAAPFYRVSQYMPMLEAACITAGYQLSVNPPAEGTEGNDDYRKARAFAARHCVKPMS